MIPRGAPLAPRFQRRRKKGRAALRKFCLRATKAPASLLQNKRGSPTCGEIERRHRVDANSGISIFPILRDQKERSVRLFLHSYKAGTGNKNNVRREPFNSGGDH